MCYNKKIINYEIISSRNLESINKKKSEIIDDIDIILSNAILFKVQSIDESEFLKFVKNITNKLRFS